ncbi:MAG: glycoside hydrolase family 3 N-terminal domain-containing protein, partial [Candidatus Hydrogenedentes bacterium]|nr:glycoside hydrolase family 3 N-terminal domain-containing protein [Candidatus Hydrogenedentota bacterium]
MPAVNRSDSWAWSITLLITCLLGVGLGLSLGYALFRHGAAAPEFASAPDASTTVRPSSSAAAPSERVAPQNQDTQSVGAAVANSDETDSVAEAATGVEQPSEAPAEASDTLQRPGDDDIWAARHLFIAVNGQWLAEGTKAFLRELKPGGVVLRAANLQSQSQTLDLVKEIKDAAGSGGGLGDLPLIAVQEEGGPYNRLGLVDSPSAQELGRSGDDERARSLGQSYAQACLVRGIGVTLSPVLDVYESGTVDPGLEARSFGTDQTVVANIGLAMVDGLRQGGVIPVVKHFPGYGASTYGSDGMLVVLNKDISGLARVMYPFKEAVLRNVQGIVVGYVAVPALDKEDPRRPAALSPILVTELLRNRWGFEGVILAADVALNEFTHARPIERTAVEALAAGCDAVVLLDANPQRIRLVRDAIEKAVYTGELRREALDRSKERLSRWQEFLRMTPSANPAAQAKLEPRKTPDAREEEAGTSGLVFSAAPVERAANPIAPAAESSEPPSEKERITVAQVQDVDMIPPEPAESQPEQVSTPEEDPNADAEDESLAPLEPEVDQPETRVEADTEPAVQTEGETPPESGAADDETTLTGEKTPSEAVPDLPDDTSGASIEEEAPETTVASEDIEPGPEPEPSHDNTRTVEAIAGEDVPSLEEAAPAESVSTPPVEEHEPKTIMVAKASTGPVQDTSQHGGSIEHTVRENELLSEIASLYGVSASDLVRWNDLRQAKLQAGSTLTIHLESEEPIGEELDFKVPSENQKGASLPDLSNLTYKMVHTVAPGDTLLELAERYKVSVDDLTLWNGLDDGAIQEGQKLTIFLGSEQEPADSAAEVKTVEYEVQPGDTLLK